jgi:hypothetical protein
MKEMEQRDPEEFARLRRLHDENPEAFREALREKVQKGRMASIGRRFPHLAEVIQSLPPEERNWLVERLDHGPFSGPPGERFSKRDEELDRLERRSSELAGAWRAADSEPRKAELRAELGRTLSAAFDRREALQAKDLEAMERRLDAIRRACDERRANREKVIESRITELLEGPPRPAS